MTVILANPHILQTIVNIVQEDQFSCVQWKMAELQGSSDIHLSLTLSTCVLFRLGLFRSTFDHC